MLYKEFETEYCIYSLTASVLFRSIIQLLQSIELTGDAVMLLFSMAAQHAAR